MKSLTKLLVLANWLLLSACIASGNGSGQAQQVHDVYYLAVGNSHYATDSAPRGFKDLEGANKSAKKVATYLDRAGARFGITLTSTRDNLVTKNDVLKALDSVLARVKRSKDRNPLVVVYLCGHGVSEGVGWNHFSIPGDFNIPLEKINMDTLADSAIYAGELSDVIQKQKLPALLLLDSCYEFDDVNLPNMVISRDLARNLTDIFKALRFLNEFRDGPVMTVFSTRPGTVVLMAADPTDPDGQLGVGPLARRLMLSFKQSFQKRKGLRVVEFLQQMSDANFDPTTKTVLTHSKPERPESQLIRYPLSENNSSEVRLGSGVRLK